MASVWEVMAKIEHRLDRGICGDDCYECASLKVISALEAYFDTGCRDAEAAVRILKTNHNEEPMCERCRKLFGKAST